MSSFENFVAPLTRYTRSSTVLLEIFTEQIRRLLIDLPGQVNMTDDILVFGKSKEEHHNNLMAVLEKLEQSGITLNKGKCEFYRNELTFYGLRFTPNGISPTEDRCKALREVPPPKDAEDLHSFLCSMLWNARFMKDMCTIAEPLWKLTRGNTEWKWGPTEQIAFESLKAALTMKGMGYFRKDWDTELTSVQSV